MVAASDQQVRDPIVQVEMPYPPSVNQAFRNKPGGGRIKTSKYGKWRREAVAVIVAQRPAKLSGPYRLRIFTARPDNRKRDIDNLIKPVSDCLVVAGVIRDDSNCVGVEAFWASQREMRGRQLIAQLSPFETTTASVFKALWKDVF